MITDKDISEARIIIDMVGGNSIQWREVRDIISRIRTESAEQARKEAAERAVGFVDQFDEDSQDGDFWTSADLRAAILGETVKEGKTSPDAFDMALRVLAFNPSVPNATGKLADMIEQYAEDYCAEKLAIAVKALEKISGRGMTGGGIAKRALKEIE